MSEVTRYSAQPFSPSGLMFENEFGHYVLFCEYEKLKAELEMWRCKPCEVIQKENAKLTRQRDILKKCAEFYADKKNWLRDKGGWRHDMIVKDLDDESLTDWEKRFSGKTARKALQEAEGME